MTVMETTTCFGLYCPSSVCLGNLRASYTHARARGVEISTYAYYACVEISTPSAYYAYVEISTPSAYYACVEISTPSAYYAYVEISTPSAYYAYVEISTPSARACI